MYIAALLVSLCFSNAKIKIKENTSYDFTAHCLNVAESY